MSYNVYFIAGDYSRQAAKTPPPRAPAAVVTPLRPQSESQPPQPINDSPAVPYPPRRPPGPISVICGGLQNTGRPPAAPRSLAPSQRPPLRARSVQSRRPVKRDLDQIVVHVLGPQDLVLVKYDQRLAPHTNFHIHIHQEIGSLHLECLTFTVTEDNLTTGPLHRWPHHHHPRWRHRPFLGPRTPM